MNKLENKSITTDNLVSINENGKTWSPSERRSEILRISGIHKKNMEDVLIQKELVLLEIELILKKIGKNFNVTKGKSDRRKYKEGKCYPNSVHIMNEKGYGYVEGYVTNKQDGDTFSHAWNVDDLGNHLDFTLEHPENYDYFGIIIPEKVVRDVGKENGYIWYSVLPFVDDNFKFKDD